MNFSFQPPVMFVFLAFRKKCIFFCKSCSSSEDQPEYKIAWPYLDWCKFCIHLRSLNVRHFGMVAATALKLWHRGHLQWHDFPNEFYRNYQLLKKCIGGQTHRQAGDLN
jgi:hypothetical protein